MLHSHPHQHPVSKSTCSLFIYVFPILPYAQTEHLSLRCEPLTLFPRSEVCASRSVEVERTPEFKCRSSDYYHGWSGFDGKNSDLCFFPRGLRQRRWRNKSKTVSCGKHRRFAQPSLGGGNRKRDGWIHSEAWCAFFLLRMTPLDYWLSHKCGLWLGHAFKCRRTQSALQ